MRQDVIKRCEKAIGYKFSDPALLQQALTHASSKGSLTLDNERLEFLGDAILGAIISGHLYQTLPDETEGELSKLKATIVSRRVQARAAKSLGLAEFIVLGKGMGKTASLPASVLANVFEAVLGAIYLDGGLKAARKFAMSALGEEMDLALTELHIKNFKSLLQELAQKEFGEVPTYRVIAEEGPDHRKEFTAVAVINGKQYAKGKGKSKKEAQQSAAQATLDMLEKGLAQDKN